jgi:hypothetical protein
MPFYSLQVCQAIELKVLFDMRFNEIHEKRCQECRIRRIKELILPQL